MSKSLERYHRALSSAAEWLEESIRHGRGGSCAYYGSWGAWSKPYPETTGYLIPTLLELSKRGVVSAATNPAHRLGDWLLSIQQPQGFWFGGVHPPAHASPSIFNTAQILQGLCALFDASGETRWLDAARPAAEWIADQVDANGECASGNYRDRYTPAYYSRVAWPLLQVWERTAVERVRSAAERLLDGVVRRRNANGAFNDWAFAPGMPAFTHTIAYTLRGLIESALILSNWSQYGQPAEEALNVLLRKAELSRGRLPGRFAADWSADRSFVCLTGNAQLAICLLRLFERENDLRLVNGACKLIDFVCASQHSHHLLSGIRGAIAGSKPLWGKYMAFRYPNWAAKFFCDGLMMLSDTLQSAGLRTSCAVAR